MKDAFTPYSHCFVMKYPREFIKSLLPTPQIEESSGNCMNQFFRLKDYGITGSSSFFTSVLIYNLSQTRPFLLRQERKNFGLRFTPTCFPLSHIGSILEVSLPFLQCQEFLFFPQVVKILGICSSITRWGSGVSTSIYGGPASFVH